MLETDSVLAAEPPVTGFGVKAPTAGEGTPEAPRFTEPVKPPMAETDTEYAVLSPGLMLLVAGVQEREKLELAAVTVTVAVPEPLPLLLVHVRANW